MNPQHSSSLNRVEFHILQVLCMLSPCQILTALKVFFDLEVAYLKIAI